MLSLVLTFGAFFHGDHSVEAYLAEFVQVESLTSTTKQITYSILQWPLMQTDFRYLF